MTLSLKNTIPTLALLVAILMMSGCGAKAALDNFANDAGDAFRKLGDDLAESGINSLLEDDECRDTDNLFNPTKCDGDYNLVRESFCINAFDAALCGATLTRVCEENINSLLCDRGIYKARRDRGLASVRENDWRTSFLDQYRNVTELEETPSHTHRENLFLANLTSEKLGLYRTTSDVLGGFGIEFDIEGEATLSRRIQQQRVFSIEDTDAVGTLTLAYTHAEDEDEGRAVFHGFKGGTEGVDIGDNNDGVSFAAVQFNSRSDDCIVDTPGAECATHRYYAGIHESTDLGKPLEAAPASGTWKGLLRTVGLSYITSMPFDIAITFDSESLGGTITADFDVVNDDNTDNYDIDATFDEFGVIKGDITITDSSDTDSPGTIRGIIGQQGAVAGFISNATGIRNDSNPIFGYAGGFVAYVPNLGPATSSTGIPTSSDACVKDNSCVDYAHWAASGADPTDTPTKDRFLKGTTVGLMGVDQGDVAGSSSLANLNPQTGDSADGFAFYRPDATGSVHNVGIYSTTRLGAPLSDTITKAQWPGRLYERSGTDAITSHPITINVGFSAGSGSGTIDGKNGVDGLYELVASYNNIGVISGTVIRTNRPGVAITGADTGAITGLIGVDGLVAVFRNHERSTVSFVGGFLAQPIPDVDYLDWVAAASPTDAPTANQFLKVMPSDLQGNSRPNFGGNLNTLVNAHKYSGIHILGAGDAGDGLAVYRVRDGAAHNAGILSTTNLGAPLTGTITNAQWPGSLLARVGTGDTIPSLITLNVNFDGTDGTIAGSNSLSDFAINARFNNVGVISGDVTHTTRVNTVLTGGSGPVTGLIGADGAVAVFRSSTNSGTNYVGGFVAQPSQGVIIVADPCIAANTCVDYAHWEAAANPTDTPTPNQFLKGTPKGLSGVGAPTDVAHLSLEDNTNYYPALNDGDDKDGFGLYRPINAHSSGSLHNVGIYSTTRLGAPLRGTFTNALWAGLLRYRVGTVIADLGVTLNVGFNAGTSAGTITYGNTGTTYEIVADFDGTGVISGGITRRVTGDTSTGTISGLIGEQGAVGVFHSTAGATTPYVGGFVASPPAPNG